MKEKLPAFLWQLKYTGMSFFLKAFQAILGTWALNQYTYTHTCT